LKPLMSACC